MRQVSLLLGILYFSFAALAVEPQQIRSFNFDFDDNIFTTEAKIYVWDKVNQREVGISTANWALYKDTVGKAGPFKDFEMREDALREFGDVSAKGENLFKEQILSSLKKGSWDSPVSEAFSYALANPKTRAQTTIISARMHSPHAIIMGLQALLDTGIISALPDIENIFPVLSPEFTPDLTGKNAAESKSKVMKFLLDRVEATPLPKDAVEIENQDGTGFARLHLWVFSDDDYENFQKAKEVLSAEVQKGRWPHVKILLIFTGQNNPAFDRHSVIIKSNGSVRVTKQTL